MADEAPKSFPEVTEEPPKAENVESEKRVEQMSQNLETVKEEKVDEKSSDLNESVEQTPKVVKVKVDVKEVPPKLSNPEKGL